jgi:GNS1/SUR4 family
MEIIFSTLADLVGSASHCLLSHANIPSVLMDPDSSWIRGIFYDLADHRTREKPFMGSPWPIIAWTICYLLLVAFLRRWMTRRKRYDVKAFSIALYVFFPLSNWFVFLKLWPNWTSKYTFGCEPLDTSSSADALEVILRKIIRYLFMQSLL